MKLTRMRRLIACLSAAGLLATASPAVGGAQPLPHPAELSSQAGIELPKFPDPLKTPQAQRVIDDAWKAIPGSVKEQFNLPTPLSSRYPKPKNAKAGRSLAPAARASFQSAVDAVVARYGGSAAIAYSDGASVTVVGDDRPRESWSTIKVPLSIAALRANPANYERARAAVTYSDNNATTAMWNSLPAGTVDQVIKEGGSRTAVPTNGWWGNTLWSTSEQAKFIANMPCIAGSQPVDSLMGQVIDEQRWGIGSIPGAHFKSGWAPHNGRWHIRQMGRIPVAGGEAAVAVTAVPGNGSYADALAMTNELGNAIRGQVSKLPVTRCR